MPAGRTSQPRRQPVIRKLFEKLCTTIRRSSGSAMSRKLGAQRRAAARRRSARRPRRRRSRCRCERQCARIVSCSARVSVQPVGLLGELTSRTRVRVGDGVAAGPRRRDATRRRATAAAASASRCAPRIAGCAVRLGQTGTTATTSSPAPTSACIASISALTPDDVTAMRSPPTGRMQRADVAGDRVAQLGQAEVVRVEGLALGERAHRRIADELRRRLVALAEPEGEHVAAAQRGVGDLADLRSGQFVDERSHGRGPMTTRGLENEKCRSTCQRQGRSEAPRPATIVGADHVRSSSRPHHDREPQPRPLAPRSTVSSTACSTSRSTASSARPSTGGSDPHARARRVRKRQPLHAQLRRAGRHARALKVSVEGRRVTLTTVAPAAAEASADRKGRRAGCRSEPARSHRSIASAPLRCTRAP